MVITSSGRRAVLTQLAAGAAVLAAPAAFAQAAWPNKPIRWINPYAPGGTTDMIARAVAQKLGERLGQQVIVENKPGAGGNIGTDLVAKAPPDGYTWVLGNIGPMSINTTMYKNMPFDAQKDFTPISLLIAYANVIIVNASSPFKTLGELLQAAKTTPQTYAGVGVGTSLHLTGELLARTANVKLTHIPYKGAAPGLQDLMGGVVALNISPIGSPMQLIKAGRVRPLAVTGPERSTLLPDVPTVAELGYPGFEVTGWLGLLVPRGTPQPIVNRLVTETTAVMQMPEIRKVVNEDMASYVPPLGPDYFTKFIASENRKWREVVTAADIKPE